MPYTPPLWDDDQWLPQEQLAGPILPHTEVPPRFATPPFLPQGPAPINASTPIRPLSPLIGAPPPGRPAFDAAAAGLASKPMHSDPALQPSTTRKVLGGLAGVALGAGAGFVNAGGRAKVDPNAGAVLADSIVNAKFNKANREYQEKQIALTAQAKLEQARADDERKTREAQAKIENYKSQAGAADARKAKSEQPTVQKPIVLPDGTVLSADGTQTVRTGVPKATAPAQNAFQEITRIRADLKLPKEQQDAAVKQVVADHNAMARPNQPILKLVTDNSGRMTAVLLDPEAVKAAGGKMDLGAGGKAAKVAKTGGAGGPSSKDFTHTMQMGNAFKSEAPVKSYEEVKQAYDAMRNAGDDGPGDLAALRYFAKITDPSTGVREGEYAEMAKSGGVKNALDLYTSGGWVSGKRLSPETKQAILRISSQIVQNRKKTVDTLKGVYKKRAQKFGVDPTDLFVEDAAAGVPEAATGKPLAENTAREYLKKAGGDPNKAREMAKKDGYTF